MTPEWERAAREGDSSFLETALSQGASVDALDRYGQTALMIAAMRGHLQVVKLLVDSGANLDRTAKYGLSATMLAVINHHQEIAELLAAAGADLRLVGSGAPGFSGKTASQLARDRNFDALAERLATHDV